MTDWNEVFHRVVGLAEIILAATVVFHVLGFVWGRYFFFVRWQTSRQLAKVKIAFERGKLLRDDIPALIGLGIQTLIYWVLFTGGLTMGVSILSHQSPTPVPWNSADMIWDLVALAFMVMGLGCLVAGEPGMMVIRILAGGVEKEMRRLDTLMKNAKFTAAEIDEWKAKLVE